MEWLDLKILENHIKAIEILLKHISKYNCVTFGNEQNVKLKNNIIHLNLKKSVLSDFINSDDNQIYYLHSHLNPKSKDYLNKLLNEMKTRLKKIKINPEEALNELNKKEYSLEDYLHIMHILVHELIGNAFNSVRAAEINETHYDTRSEKLGLFLSIFEIIKQKIDGTPESEPIVERQLDPKDALRAHSLSCVYIP